MVLIMLVVMRCNDMSKHEGKEDSKTTRQDSTRLGYRSPQTETPVLQLGQFLGNVCV